MCPDRTGFDDDLGLTADSAGKLIGGFPDRAYRCLGDSDSSCGKPRIERSSERRRTAVCGRLLLVAVVMD